MPFDEPRHDKLPAEIHDFGLFAFPVIGLSLAPNPDHPAVFDRDGLSGRVFRILRVDIAVGEKDVSCFLFGRTGVQGEQKGGKRREEEPVHKYGHYSRPKAKEKMEMSEGSKFPVSFNLYPGDHSRKHPR